MLFAPSVVLNPDGGLNELKYPTILDLEPPYEKEKIIKL